MNVWTGGGNINILVKFPYSTRVVEHASGGLCMEFRSGPITSAMEWSGPALETRRLLERAVKFMLKELFTGTESVDFTALVKRAKIELEAEDAAIRLSLDELYGTEREYLELVKQEEVEVEAVASEQGLAGEATEAT